MRICTASVWPWTALLLLFSFYHGAVAQPAPSWRSASALGAASYIAASATDVAGNLYVTGFFTGSAGLTGATLTSAGGADSFVAKLTPTGTLLWVRQFGSTGDEVAANLVVDDAGNVYVSGQFNGAFSLSNNLTLSAPTRSAFLIRYSPQGIPEWAQQSTATGNSRASSGASGLGLDAAGNVYLAGAYSAELAFGSMRITPPNSTPINSKRAAYLSRFSAATGEVRSLKNAFYYSSAEGAFPHPELVVTPTGTTYVVSEVHDPSPTFDASTTLSNRGDGDGFIAQYNAEGLFQWVRQFGGAGDDQVIDAAVTAAGDVYVVGQFTGPATFGTLTVPGVGKKDMYLAKYSSQGALEWVQTGGGAGADTWVDVLLDAAGNPYVTGLFEEQARVGTQVFTSVGATDIIVAAYSGQGQFKWAQQAGSSGYDFGELLAITPSGDLSVIGRIRGASTFGTLSLSPTTANAEYYLAHLGTSVLATQPARPQSLDFYPNPATDWVNLRSLTSGTRVRVVDALGRVLREEAVTATGQVSIWGLAPGLYWLQATSEQGNSFQSKLTIVR